MLIKQCVDKKWEIFKMIKISLFQGEMHTHKQKSQRAFIHLT